MSVTFKNRAVVVALTALSAFTIAIRLPSVSLGLPPYIFVDEIFFFDDTFRSLNKSFFYPQAFISGSMNELPFWMFAKLFMLFGYEFSYNGFLVFGRLIGPVFLAGLTIFPLYHAAKNFTGRRAFGISAAVIFTVSEWIFSNSQIWYPDHYIYFYVSVFLWQLSKFWARLPHSYSAYKLGISLGLVVSVKYTALIFVLLMVLIILNRPSVSRNSNSSTKPYLQKSLVTFVTTFIVLNFSIFKYFHGFLAGMNSNRRNYRFFTSLPFENLFAYSQLLFLVGLGWVGLFSLMLGASFWYRTKKQLLAIFSTVIAIYLLGLSTSPIMLPRNINIVLPILIIIASPGLGLFMNLLKKVKPKTLISGSFALFAFLGSAVHLGNSFLVTTQKQSTSVLEDYLMSRQDENSLIGVNFGSNGPSPVETLGLPFVNDPEMNENLELYVFNSYWESPIREYFFSRGYFSQLSSRDFHFNESSPKSALIFFPRKEKLEDYVPAGYQIARIIESVGPVYVVLERVG